MQALIPLAPAATTEMCRAGADTAGTSGNQSDVQQLAHARACRCLRSSGHVGAIRLLLLTEPDTARAETSTSLHWLRGRTLEHWRRWFVVAPEAARVHDADAGPPLIAHLAALREAVPERAKRCCLRHQMQLRTSALCLAHMQRDSQCMLPLPIIWRLLASVLPDLHH